MEAKSILKAFVVRTLVNMGLNEEIYEVERIEDTGRLKKILNDIHERMEKKGEKKKLLAIIPISLNQAYAQKTNGCKVFRGMLQATKGKEIKRIQQDNVDKNEEGNAWTKILRIANCLNLVGMALKNATRGAQSKEGERGDEKIVIEEMKISEKMSKKCVQIGDDDMKKWRSEREREVVKNYNKNRREERQEEQKNDDLEEEKRKMIAEAAKIVEWKKEEKGETYSARLNREGAKRMRDIL